MKYTLGYLSSAGAMAFATVAATALAASDKAVMKASIAANCTIVAVGELNFGALDQSSNESSATSSVFYWCTKGTPYTITLDNGENYDAGSAKRQMKQLGGTGLLPYQLSIDKESGIGNGLPVNERMVLSGTIFGHDIRSSIAADYVDNVTVTIEP